MLAKPELIISFAEHLKRIGKKDSTIQSYSRDLKKFLEYLHAHKASLSSISFQTFLHFRRSQKGALEAKNNSFRRAVIAIRQFYKWLPQVRDEIQSLEKIPIPNREECTPKKLDSHDLDLLFQKCYSKVALKTWRDRTIVALLCYEGLKVSEIVELEWKHFLYHGKQSTLLVPGEKKRVIHLHSKTVQILLEYKKQAEKKKALLPKSSKMILGFKGKELPVILPEITRHGLKYILYELGEGCRIPHLNTETLRHHAIDFHLENGMSPENLMRHLGLKQLGNIAKHKAKLQNGKF